MDESKQINYFYPILQAAVRAHRQQQSVRDWIEETWIALCGPASLRSAQELTNTATLFELLSYAWKRQRQLHLLIVQY